MKKEGTPLSDEQEKVASFYASAMDEAACDAAGVEPLKDAFECCERARDPANRA